MLTLASNDLLCFSFVRCAGKVSELINRPVVCLFGTRVGGARANMVTKGVYLKFLATTSRERFLRNHWDLSAHGGGKECLPETSRPGFISTVRPVEGLVHRIPANHLSEKQNAIKAFTAEGFRRNG